MMDGLPKSVRIGPHDIRITQSRDEENYGAFCEPNLQIEMRDSYIAGSLAVDSAVHELLHAIWFVASIKVEHGEEQIVSVLGTFLAQIIRDNPELITWMQETVKK